MKHYLFCIQFFLITSFGFSQTNTKEFYNVSKSKLENVKSFNEIILDFPVDINLTTTEIMAKSKGQLVSIVSKGSNVSPQMQTILKNADINTKIYIDIKYNKNVPGDKKEYQKKYTIKVIN